MRALAREGIVEMSGDSAKILVPLFRDWTRQIEGTLDMSCVPLGAENDRQDGC